MTAHRPTPAPPRRVRLLVLSLAVTLALVALVALAAARRAGVPDGPTAGPDRAPAFADGWLRRAAAPVALTEVAAAAHEGRVWIAGGLDAEGRATDRVFAYEPLADAWVEGPRLPAPVHHSSLVANDGALSLVGGFGGDGRPVDRVLMLRAGGGSASWQDGEPLPEARGAGAAAIAGGRLVYAGGVGPEGVSAAVFVLDEGGWSSSRALLAPREHLAAASGADGRAYVLGGRQGGLDTNVATAEVLDEGGAAALGDLPTPRGGVAAFWVDGSGACLVGGESPGGTHPEVECIAAAGAVTVLPALRVARHGSGAAVIDGVAYVVLGGPEPGLFVSDVVEALALR